MGEYIEWLPQVPRSSDEIMTAIRQERDEKFPLNYFLTLRMQFYDSDVCHAVEEASDCLRARLSSFHQRGFESGCLIGLRVLDEIMAPGGFNRLGKKLSSLIAQEEQFAKTHYPREKQNTAIVNGLLGYAMEGLVDMPEYGALLGDPEMLLQFGDQGIFAVADGFGLMMALRHEVLQDIEFDEHWESMLSPTSKKV